MFNIAPLEPVNYLVIGHLTYDLLPNGSRLGGTVSYAGLTAHALGLKVGIVTSWGCELPLQGELKHIPIINYPTEHSTTFENIYTDQGRIQIVHTVAPRLDYHMIPEPWREAPIVHLGPVAQEVEPGLVRHFSNSLVGVTPQGWLRTWDEKGHVHASEWPEASFTLQQCGAAVFSVEDVLNDESRIEEMASASRILVVTEGAAGARVYWNGDVRRFRPPQVEEVDATGAGDIFAAAFFIRLYLTRDPWESARFANQVASTSVTRRGLEGIPTFEEVKDYLIEVI
ncbi:MAG TPA: PfkB family carbohydrate kinase [Anaerolineales bacterium]|nr:PfkB family carbohydrate kinase [Anaerolineales bacterium]